MDVCGRQGDLLLLLVLVAGASIQVAAQAPSGVASGVIVVGSTAPGEALPQHVGKEIWAGELVGTLPPSQPQSWLTFKGIC
jgi:hypothetical protein